MTDHGLRMNNCKIRRFIMKDIKRIISTSAFRLIFIVIIVIIPINILTLVLSSTTIEEVERQMSTEMQSVLDLYMTQIDVAIENITNKIHSVAIDDEDFARLNVKDINSKKEYYNQMQSAVNLKNTLSDILFENTWVTGLFVSFPEKDIQLVKSKYSSYNKDSLKKWKVAKIHDNYAVLFVAKYKNAYYGAWFDLKRLAYAFDLNEESGDSILAFADDMENICYSNHKDMDLIEVENIYQNTKQEYVVIQSNSKHSNLSLLQILSKSEMVSSLPNLILILKGASLIALFILPIIILSLKKWMIDPLNKLSHAMERIEKGDMEFRIKEKNTGSEFDQINRNFNHMMDEVSNLKIDVYEEKLEKQKIRMRFLSQQIKPHFILNAINILYSYEQEEYPLIQKMILCISKYFRYVVNANSPFVELKQEMEHIRNYFEIQEARYPETFFARVEYDKDLGNCLVPPLLIQNFAENAIKYSLRIGVLSEISVLAQRHEEDFIKIMIIDTGEGISFEVLEKIRIFRETRVYQKGLGVGIQNAIERLDAFYGAETKLEISREEPHGTRIEIILPIHQETEDKYA